MWPMKLKYFDDVRKMALSKTILASAPINSTDIHTLSALNEESNERVIKRNVHVWHILTISTARV